MIEAPNPLSRGGGIDSINPLLASGHIGLAMEHLIHEDIVNLLIAIHAKITKDGDAVVEVGGVTDSRKDGATGSNASNNEFLGIVATEDEVEVGTEEGGNAALDNDRLAMRGEQGGLSGQVTLLEQASSGDAGYGSVGGVGFGVPGTERSDNVEDLDVVLAGCIHSLIQALEVNSGVTWNHVEDALLDIEDEEGSGSHDGCAEVWMTMWW
jgi:hypothetical protein